ncbi:MAG: DinB family protein [Opitutaceae bacterium]|nr:DinB family protein [Cytophagales bacterium]
MEQLTNEIQNHTEELLTDLNFISDTIYFAKPSAEQWSIAEVVAHLYISDSVMKKVMTGAVKASNRDSNEKTDLIRTAFLNYDKKYNALEVLLPKPGVNKSKNEMLSKLAKVRASIISSLSEQDPTWLCLDFTHPYFGQMTINELGYLTLYHSIRHFNQIKKTKEAVC